ncbi:MULTISPECIES: CPBP family glutamic-type intramembrane protease [unclassified Tychonema]|uniref:CPBP family glutamic-type intramembrane protease n=1 Tax=unclassified Tychonema TaxID=2642144 RepID=UPI001D147D98|nr:MULTISPECIES: CPBP family glutamic-type intramembrane protease [unclassified Tychonema]
MINLIVLNFSPIGLLDLLARRVTLAVSTIPDFTDWLVAAMLALVYTAIALPVGFGSGFLKVDVQTSSPTITGVLIGCLLTPGLSEEVFFRVLMLPHPGENASGLMLWFWGWASLALFVVYHPLNALTFYPIGRSTFMNPVFLLLAAILGVACSGAYLQSGSIWPAVAVHWLAVTAWLLLLGGYRRLYG